MYYDRSNRKYTIVVDTREKKPITFPDSLNTIKKALNPGDYSVLGYEKKIVIERKSIDDYISCVIEFRRLSSQIRRLKDIEYRMIIVTGSYKQCVQRLENQYYLDSKITFKKFNSILHYAERLGVNVYFIDEEFVSDFIINQFDTWLKWLKEEEKKKESIKELMRYRF